MTTVRRIASCIAQCTRVRCATFAAKARSSHHASMKPSIHIANTTALRPQGHGLAACGLSRGEGARTRFIPLD